MSFPFGKTGKIVVVDEFPVRKNRENCRGNHWSPGMFGTGYHGQQFTGLLAREHFGYGRTAFSRSENPLIGFPEPFLIFIYLGDSVSCGKRPRALPSGHPRFFEKNRVKLFLFLPEESGILPIRRIYISRRKSSPSSGWCEAVRPRRINSGVTPPARIRRNRWCGGREGRPGCWKRR